jgi:hypothetical protein
MREKSRRLREIFAGQPKLTTQRLQASNCKRLVFSHCNGMHSAAGSLARKAMDDDSFKTLVSSCEAPRNRLSKTTYFVVFSFNFWHSCRYVGREDV